MNWIKKLRKQGACDKGIDWASQFESPQEAWSACERGDWMLWAWGRNCGKRGSKSHRQLVLVCVECARSSVKYVKNEEIKKVIQKSLDTTERWARGEKTVSSLNDVKNAANAARSARYADYAASRAADAACAAANAAWSAAWYAARAACAAADATGTRECFKVYKEFSDMIRKIQPECPIILEKWRFY